MGPVTGIAVHTLTALRGGISALVVAPDGSWDVSAGGDIFGGGEEVRI